MWWIVGAIAAAGTLGSFTDWLFMGVLFHGAYNKYPEVWWPRGRSESRAILWSSVIGYVMSAGVVGLCVLADASSIPRGLGVAALAWTAGPLVVVVINGFFIKIDPKITFAHCVGWLARMALAGAAAAGFALGPMHAMG
jgi:hypothetical protein